MKEFIQEILAIILFIIGGIYVVLAAAISKETILPIHIWTCIIPPWFIVIFIELAFVVVLYLAGYLARKLLRSAFGQKK